jgi:(p)ppGpp synthase/HD superfamily hydrolase
MPIPPPSERPDLYDDFDCRPDPGYSAPEESLPEWMQEAMAKARAKKQQKAAPENKPALTDRFADALAYAERLHRTQTRKGNRIPYVAHLMAVCATVLEWGGDEDTAIAALLHDAVEDQGGLETLTDIRIRFGDRVAGIVAACSDSTTADSGKKAPWLERKRRHIDHLAGAGMDVALVTAADKLHNITAMIRDIRRHGAETMKRFNATPEQVVWYNRQIVGAMAEHRDVAPVTDLEEATATLAGLLHVAA